MSPPRSVLELLHAEGRAPRIRIIGSACPAALGPAQVGDPGSPRAVDARSEGGEGPADAAADLVILVPGVERGEDAAWLRRATRRSAVELAPDGLLYSLAPVLLRRKLRRLLRAEGLRVRLRVAHRPHWRHTRYLVPMRPAAVRFAFSALMPSGRETGWRLAGAAYRAAMAAGLDGWLPTVAEVFGRPAERKPLEWLARVPEASTDADGVVRVKMRGDSGRAVLHRIPAGARAPSHVLKTGLGSGACARGEREAETLARLWAGAERAGARLPRVVETPSRPELLAQTAVAGRPASVVLSRRPRRLDGLLAEIACWLGRWHGESRQAVRLERAFLRRHVLRPAARLHPGGVEGTYLEWLEARTEALEGRTVQLVATHNDLTMENVIVADGGPPGVVDWAEGSERGLPLGDFYYATVDAVATAEGHGDRVRAVRDCFTPEGLRRGRTLGLERKISAAADVSPDFAVLCFHACWLRHAANELAKSGGRGARPFLNVVRWQARRIGADSRAVEPRRA